MSIIVDEASPMQLTYDGPQRYGLFFELPTLPAGPHNITLSEVSDVSIDFAVITTNTSAGNQFSATDYNRRFRSNRYHIRGRD